MAPFLFSKFGGALLATASFGLTKKQEVAKRRALGD